MSHLVYKKTLQSEKAREKYIGERKDLKKARAAGIIDENGYIEGKKQIEPQLENRVRSDSAPGFFLPDGNGPQNPRTRANSVYSSASDGSADSTRHHNHTQIPPTSPPTKVKKGTIFDRNNLAIRLYKPDAQTEEQREAKKLQRKTQQLRDMEAASIIGRSDEPSLDFMRTSEEFQRYWGSISSSSSTRSNPQVKHQKTGSRFNLFTRNNNKSNEELQISNKELAKEQKEQVKLQKEQEKKEKAERERERLEALRKAEPRKPTEKTMPLLATTGTFDCLLGPLPMGDTQSSSWSLKRSVTTSSYNSSSSSAGSARTRSRKESNATSAYKSSISSKQIPEIPPVSAVAAVALASAPTLADRILFGVKTPPPAPTPSLTPSNMSTLSRRHSFTSDRPSTSHSRHSWRPSRPQSGSVFSGKSGRTDKLPFGLTNGYDELNYTPPSLLLLDVFASLIDEFESTPKIFSFARDEEYKSSCAASLVDGYGDPGSFHPGHLVGFGDESENLRTALRKRIWFLMAVKWLYFGRVLFSPGHHLLMMGGEESLDGAPPRTGDELRVLDLDGPAMADWAWHTAREYPDAFVYVTYSTDSPLNSPISPLTAEYASPANLRRVQLPIGHTSLAPLQTGSIDVISSRFLPSLIPKDGWLPLVLELGRVLKYDGYIELTILDPVLNDMGPLLRAWILENVLSDPTHPRTFDIMPSKSVLSALREAGFGDIQKVWMWMPAVSVGDELSTVTSRIGRFLYDELYCPKEGGRGSGAMGGEGLGEQQIGGHEESEVWRDEAVMEECRRHNTAFRWLRVWARKGSGAGNCD
ncbi:Similar to hypothetical protein [Tuber melanosporum Mel28]; acc. no. XP_002837879 [Pyronema omphalodes CBS 100304]|uniref:Methyltransferase type 11 domain-containing protein n=1 Tax=Pyronema omphalodes (strain CBS 100304) TaxID=1076935 RepID=U4LH55_PYROM|nr:Similar to hypothetical protein [Tuber melanosporum Mel28]; acc. no. XP_002837879 [Pyronema omphalodes CBS 100304]